MGLGFLFRCAAALSLAASVAAHACGIYRQVQAGTVHVEIPEATSKLDPEKLFEGGPHFVRIEWAPKGIDSESKILPPIGRFNGHVFPQSGLKGRTKGQYYEEILKRMEEMAEHGYTLGDVWLDKGSIQLFFVKRPELVKASERTKEPAWVADQRKLLREKATKLGEFIPADVWGDQPGVPLGEPLTSKTLQKLEPGEYDWVRLRGENFVRLGKKGHIKAGGGEDALGAGHIVVEKKGEKNEITTMSNQTGTYSEVADFMVNGIEGLWRQGIYPTDLQLLHWSKSDDKLVPMLRLKAP